MRRHWINLLVIIGAVLAVDQISKMLVLRSLSLGRPTQPIPAFAPFFQLTYSQNTGASFGILPQASDLFLVIAVVVVVVMLFSYPRVPEKGNLTRFAIGLICGGALGNALDRLQHGFVVDFIHYQIPGLISNVSNLADHAIILGVILIFVDSWLLDRKKNVDLEPITLEAEPGEETPTYNE